MPLVLDATSTIGMAMTVLGPSFLAAKATMPADQAAVLAWQVGMATMVLIGLFKLVMSFLGDSIRRAIPAAGLLGSLGGIGIALLGTLQLGEIFGEPVAGMIALGLIIYTLVAKIRLPFRTPAVLASVAVGAIIYYILGLAGIGAHPMAHAGSGFPIGLPIPTLGFIAGMKIAVTQYIPLALPFAVLTVIGGINVTESARYAGDDYNTRNILLTEAIATLLAGVCGGVSQSTPYIGHPAYKQMGGKAAYTLATGLFVGLGGMFGYIAFMAGALPIPILAPILVFVALDITEQSYLATPHRHAAAVTLAILPSIAQLVQIFLSQVHNGALLNSALDVAATVQATGIANESFIRTCGVMIVLAHGFILTGMLWGGAVAFLIDKKAKAAATTLFVCAFLSFFGIMHSVLPSGGVYLPWNVPSNLPYHWTAAYAGFALLILILSSTREFKEAQAVQ
jgi:AGZA family xanthine/uracil permease-like MFS transporter